MIKTRLFASLAAVLGFASASQTAAAARFDTLRIPDPAGGEIEIGVWSPAEAGVRPAPLVVMSHGNGGWYRGAADTAEALADAGFVAAALTHTGDNFRDQSRATDMANRPRLLTDYMLQVWRGPVAIDPARVGAFGFSSGAFTVLTAAGAESDAQAIVRHCQGDAAFYDCRLMAAHPPAAPALTGWTHDPRLKAVVAAAPALGFSFTDASLKSIRASVQLWRGEQDRVLPSPLYAEPVRDRLALRPEYHVVPGADHYDFLPPCNAALAASNAEICASQPGFDRVAFHRTFNAEVVRFFREALH